MTVAYVDTSALLAIAFAEPGASDLAARIRACDKIICSALLEAEYQAAMHREEVDPPEGALDWLSWVLPDRRLTPEIERVLEEGYLRGADLHHLATALYVTPEPSHLGFLTADQRQSEVADRLGFAT